VNQPRFAHASEAELARILDYYDVRWEYEPHTFPILWNLDGAVVESFSPDFFLPELSLYIELTTLKQSLVRRKNRKLRRLRELYPDVRVKLFYGKDFKALMLKYGRFDIAASLSGLEGQTLAQAVAVSAAAAARSTAATGHQAAATQPSGSSRRRVSRGTRRRRARRTYLAAATG
jgi:hypoxanthine phosphoribosyltransferase